MAGRKRPSTDSSPSERLESAVDQALHVVRKARKHRISLSSDNFYANKLAELRAEASNAFRDLSSQSAGDVTAMAEMMEIVFSGNSISTKRLATARDLLFSLKTTWRQPARIAATEEGFFPMSILMQANRGYLVTVGHQMNGCFSAGWYDASAVMMR